MLKSKFNYNTKLTTLEGMRLFHKCSRFSIISYILITLAYVISGNETTSIGVLQRNLKPEMHKQHDFILWV
jgi:hypothetical protein